VLFEKIVSRFGADLSGRVFGVWGLAFKPGTDDMRDASSKVLLRELIAAGARVRAYDPVAMPTAQRELPDSWLQEKHLTLVDRQYDALQGADAMILVTEWKPFRHPDFSQIKSLLRQPIIFDGRNQYDLRQMRDCGFEYFGIGRKTEKPV
jgi:UDPglucose 6-dehydrogenase